MKFILLLVCLSPLTSAILSDCEKEFLKNCRSCVLPKVPSDSCPPVGYNCNVDEEELGNFEVSNGKFGRDCDSIRCKEPGATLHVDGVPYESIACSENLWRFGKHYALNTTTAACFKRCDNCKTLPDMAKTKRAEIIAPVIGTPCASAKCQDGYQLVGKPVVGKTHLEFDEGVIISCSGDRLWDDGTGTKYTSVYCKLIEIAPTK